MRNRWKSWLGSASLFVALVLVVNPELRALLMLVDAFGLEALLILVVAQWRFHAPVFFAAVFTVLQSSMEATCRGTFTVLDLTTRTIRLFSPYGFVTHLLQFGIAAVTQDLKCEYRVPNETRLTT